MRTVRERTVVVMVSYLNFELRVALHVYLHDARQEDASDVKLAGGQSLVKGQLYRYHHLLDVLRGKPVLPA